MVGSPSRPTWNADVSVLKLVRRTVELEERYFLTTASIPRKWLCLSRHRPLVNRGDSLIGLPGARLPRRRSLPTTGKENVTHLPCRRTRLVERV
jgi:hypothetical protein